MSSGMLSPTSDLGAVNGRLDNLTTDQSALPQDDKHWKRALHISEIVIYVVLAITIWLFFCLVVYGTQTKRWKRKAGSSSLSSGAIYVVCVLATGLSILPLVITASARWMSHYGNFNACAETEGAVELLFYSSLYLTYFFLWILQRRIYTHPCVKDRVNRCVNIMSVCLVPMLVSTFVVTAALFLKSLGNAFEYSESAEACVLKPIYQNDAVVIILSSTTVALVAQILMVAFTIYPAFRAKFPAVDQDSDYPESVQPEGNTEKAYNCCKLFCQNSFRSTRLTSPIHAHVQRAVRSTLLILVANCFGVVIDLVIIAPDMPPTVHRITGHVVVLVSNFCMVATFPYATQVLTVLWPSCSTIKTSRSNYLKKDVAEKKDSLEKPDGSANISVTL